MEHPEAEHDVEGLVEAADRERVESPVLDRAIPAAVGPLEARRGLELHAEAPTHPIDVLLVVDRDDAAGSARLGQECVEAVEAPDVEDAPPLKRSAPRTCGR